MNTARPATKLKSFAFSSRASRLRGESPAQDSPRSREERQEREYFAKKNPFLPQRIFGLVLRSNPAATKLKSLAVKVQPSKDPTACGKVKACCSITMRLSPGGSASGLSSAPRT